MNLFALQRLTQLYRQPFVRFSLLAVLMAFCLCASTAQCQTATYSDSYVVDNSGIYYDAENDAWVLPQDSWSPPVIVGAGVTDADYNSYSESVETTFYGASGSVASTSYDEPSARAEVTLAPPNDDNEYDYQVQTVHRYWVDDLLAAVGPKCGGTRRCIQQVSYRPASLSFFEVFTEAIVTVRVARSSYQYTGRWAIPPPTYLLKQCLFRKVCGSCGNPLDAAYVSVFQSCPNYIGIEWLRWHMPFGGSFCAATYWQPGVYFFCS